MKRTVCLAVALLLFASGCAANTGGAPAKGATPAPIATAEPRESAAPTPAVDRSFPDIPVEDRNYYEPYGASRDLHGSDPYSEQDLKYLAVTLRFKTWKSLGVVLEAFGSRIYDAATQDVRSYDLEKACGEFDVELPRYDEEHGIAYISLAERDTFLRNKYLLLFKKDGHGAYRAASIVALREDYYLETPHFYFAQLGRRDYLIWNGLSGHGTGYLNYREAWYDTDTGRCMYSYDTYGNDVPWDTEHDESEVWETSVSHEAIPFFGAFNYILEAHARQTFEADGFGKAVYECDYAVYYDAASDRFYTAYDALKPLYAQAEKSPSETVRAWAQRERAQSEKLRSGGLLPAEDARAELPAFSGRIERLNLDGKTLTEDQLEGLWRGLSSIKLGDAGEMRAILSESGLWAEDDQTNGNALKGSVLDGVKNASCAMDTSSCQERIVLIHLAYDLLGQRRGVSFLYTMDERPDRWSFFGAFSYSLARERGAIEAKFLPASVGCVLKVPVAMANGQTLYESYVFHARGLPEMSFVSDYYDAQGYRHALYFSSGCGERAQAVASLSAVVYEPERSEALYEETVDADVFWDREKGRPFVTEEAYRKLAVFFGQGEAPVR